MALILASSPLAAEFLHVELTIGGLDCISCASSVDRALKRIKGVETATFRTQDSIAVVDLKPGNTVPIEQIRDAVKGIGYTPGSARIVALGEAYAKAGKWIFRVAGSDAEYTLDLPSGLAPLHGPMSIVEGTITNAGAALKVSAMRPSNQ